MVRYNLIIFFLFSFSFLRGQSFPEPNIDYLVKTGIWHLVVNNYSEAERHFELLNKYYPENPFGELTLVIEEIAKASDYGRPFDLKKIKSLLKIAERKSDSLLSADMNAWNYFFAGAVSGLRTYYEYLVGDYLSVIFDGFSAVDNFNNCLTVDAGFSAANIGIGTYKYWKSDALKSYDWLPFFTDESDEGLNQLLLGIKNTSYLSSFGTESLIWIYLHEKEYNKAYLIAKKSLERYPNSRFFLWGVAHAAKFKDKEEALGYFYKILTTYEKDSIINKIRKIQILHKTALLLESLGRYGEALENCRKALNIKNLTEFELENLNNRLKRVEQLRLRLVKRIENK